MTLLILITLFAIVLALGAFFAESSTDTYAAHITETDLSLIDWMSEDI